MKSCMFINGRICLSMQGARNEIFAMQPAPIQVSYMGFPGTTGADYIHYLVTDEVGGVCMCRFLMHYFQIWFIMGRDTLQMSQ